MPSEKIDYGRSFAKMDSSHKDSEVESSYDSDDSDSCYDEEYPGQWLIQDIYTAIRKLRETHNMPYAKILELVKETIKDVQNEEDAGNL